MRKRIRDKKKEIVVSSVVAIICVFLEHYLTLKEIDYEVALNNETIEELLLDAQKYYSIEEYEQAISIYMMDEVKTNAVALNNLGYIYENGVAYEKNIEKARKYYRNAASLGNLESIENYVIFTIKYPRSFQNLLEVLKFGFEKNSEMVTRFIGSYYSRNDISREDVQGFLQMSYERQIELLKYQVTIRLKEETEEIADEMIQEREYFEVEERMLYKTLEYDLQEDDVYRKKMAVNIPIPVGSIRIYYMNFLFGQEYSTKFIYL